MPSIVPGRKKRKSKKKINDNEIIFVKPTKKNDKRSLQLQWNKNSKKQEKKKKKKEKRKLRKQGKKQQKV